MKKKNYSLIAIVWFSVSAWSQGIGINETGAAPDPSAILDASSTTRGFLPPRINTAERDAFVEPAEGLIIYNTDLKCVQFNKGTPADPNWICSDGTNESNPPFICGISNIIDTRDNITYNTVLIGTQCWLKENLKYLPSVNTLNTSSLSTPYYYVYGYNGTDVTAAKLTFNYNTYGVLYNWSAAMNNAATSALVPSGVQGVCPEGWHIPSKGEWDQLVNELGGSQVAGGKIKAVQLWSDLSFSSNSSGFSALPGGSRVFLNIQNNGFWWSATEQSSTKVWMVDLWKGSTNFSYTNWNLDKSDGQPVRCIKD